jgi:GAF domain-containing protein
MNARTILQSGCDALGAPAVDGGGHVPSDRLDLTLAACSRLLLGDENPVDALQEALARLASGLDALHVTLFQIESYHTEDNRGRWRACSAAGLCPYCQDSREWDYVRLIDEGIRARMEKGQCCHLKVAQLPPDFQGDFCARHVDHLVILPLTVLGKWWGFLCIEAVPEGFRWTPARGSHLETLGALFSVYYERRHAVEGCQERNALSGALEMAGTVCHKLNQPMQVILGYASMVTSGDIREKEQIIEIVQLIEDETRQMGIITKNLMGITKNRGAE